MKTLLSKKDRADLERRIGKLTVFSEARWGKLSVMQVILHLTTPLMLARDEEKGQFKRASFMDNPLLWACSLPAIKLIASQFFPWWEGAPTAPEFMEGLDRKVDFSISKAELAREMRDFAAAASNHLIRKFSPHPVFGELSKEQWARLMWRHIDWHLRQFGV